MSEGGGGGGIAGFVGFILILVVVNLCSYFFNWGFWLYWDRSRNVIISGCVFTRPFFNANKNLNDRQQNIAFAITFFSWAVMRIVSAEASDRWTIPQICPAVVQFFVGLLFLRRQPAQHFGSWNGIAWALPTFIAGGLLMRVAPPSHEWNLVAQVFFLIGTFGTVMSLLVLGKSFAIFPAIRKLVSNGPYRLIRHPAYFFEIMMLVAAFWASQSTSSVILLPIVIATFLIRIWQEEKLLSTNGQYRDYAQRVRYRLIPWVW